MTMAEADHILGMSPERLGAFISERISDKTFSQLVQSLNEALMHGDEAARGLAQRVLERLGLLDVA